MMYRESYYGTQTFPTLEAAENHAAKITSRDGSCHFGADVAVVAVDEPETPISFWGNGERQPESAHTRAFWQLHLATLEESRKLREACELRVKS